MDVRKTRYLDSDIIEILDDFKIKAEEKKRGPEQVGRFKDLPNQLPALMFAQDVYKQIQKQKMDAADVIDEGGIAMTAQALADDEQALGKQLFEIAAACRIKKLEPEAALRRYAQSVVDQLEKKALGRFS